VVATDARALLDPAASVGIVVASLAVVAGHVATFVLAARAVGVRMPVVELLPLVLLVLVVSALPLNLAGWGPREGAAAGLFAAAGLGATQGLAVAVAYGTIVFVATLPGALLFLVGRSRWSPTRMPSGARRRDRADAPAAAHALGAERMAERSYTVPGSALTITRHTHLEPTDAGRSILVPDDLRLEAQSSSGQTS
jgi:hypothetical protein